MTSIGKHAFRGCTSLTSVVIGDGVTSIDAFAFAFCASLTDIYYTGTATEWSAVTKGSNWNYNTGAYTVHFNYGAEEETEPETEPASLGLAYEVNDDGTTCAVTGLGTCTDTDVLIPKFIDGYKVTDIGERAFADCTAITSITIPDTVTTIGIRAFYGCTGITEITIPASVTSIGTQIFYKASNLGTVYYNSTYGSYENSFLSLSHITKVVFGGTSVPGYILKSNAAVSEVLILDGVTSIGYEAFRGCTGLTSVTIGDSVTSISSSAFEDCTGLTSVTIGDSEISIGYEAFRGCTGLTSVTIGDSVTSIGSSAFDGCANLAKVYITDLEAWCSISFSGSGSNPMCYGADLYLNGELVTEIEIPDTIGVIKAHTFYGCKSLTNVIIPDSVTTIGSYAFYNCAGMTSVTIGDSVTTIGERAFYGCTSLTSVVIPDSVTTIGSYAFRDCSSLTSIYYTGTKAEWNAITKGSYWDYATGAYTVHYNYVPEE